jgi:hypothetical protein
MSAIDDAHPWTNSDREVCVRFQRVLNAAPEDKYSAAQRLDEQARIAAHGDFGHDAHLIASIVFKDKAKLTKPENAALAGVYNACKAMGRPLNLKTVVPRG